MLLLLAAIRPAAFALLMSMGGDDTHTHTTTDTPARVAERQSNRSAEPQPAKPMDDVLELLW